MSSQPGNLYDVVLRDIMSEMVGVICDCGAGGEPSRAAHRDSCEYAKFYDEKYKGENNEQDKTS